MIYYSFKKNSSNRYALTDKMLLSSVTIALHGMAEIFLIIIARQEKHEMESFVNFSLDESPVRFTNGGKIFVLDAISILSKTDRAKAIWKNMKKENPQINKHIEYHPLPGNLRVPITDSSGWEKISVLLFDHLY